METLFLNAIAFISDWRCWILPPALAIILYLVIREIFTVVQGEIEEWWR